MASMSELADLAYEAAVVPERWKTFLDAGGQEAGALGGTLFSVQGISRDSIISDCMYEAWLAIIKTDWGAKNPLPSRAIAARQPGFVHDLEVLPEAERADLEWFTDFAPKWNLGPSMGTVLQVPNGNRLLLTFERPYSAKPYTRADASRFDVLRPSVARAVSLSSQLAYRQFQQTTALLGSLGLPGAVIDERGKLLNANLEFETLIPSCFVERQRRTHIRHSAADTLLQEALARIRPELWSGTVGSIPVPT